MKAKRKNRADCFWGMHSDFHAHPNYGTIIGATLKEKDIRSICENAKPDFIQIDCKGHPGVRHIRCPSSARSTGMM